MPTRQRYHIHVCLVRNEHPEFENALQVAFADNYFLTWDLIAHPSNFMDYSRQQIDRCDYLLFVLGNGYGYLSPSGVSFLHLSYIYAVTKRKPMLALIKNPNSTINFSRQRLDLASLIQKDLGDNVIHFDLTQEAITAGLTAIKQLSQRFPVSGWQRASMPIVRSVDNVLQPKSVEPNDDYSNSNLLFSPMLTAQPCIPNEALVKDAKDTIATTPHTVSTLSSINELDVLSLNDTVMVNYSAHAYQGGNLQDILADHVFRWADILALLRPLPQPFSDVMMLKSLNDSLKEVALKEASKTLPNVHAVSRCQINNTDFQWIKKQLLNNQWLLRDSTHRNNRELWRLNPAI